TNDDNGMWGHTTRPVLAPAPFSRGGHDLVSSFSSRDRLPVSLVRRGPRRPDRHGADAAAKPVVLPGRLPGVVVARPAAVARPAPRLPGVATPLLPQGGRAGRAVRAAVRPGADDDLRRPRADDAGPLGAERHRLPPHEARPAAG